MAYPIRSRMVEKLVHIKSLKHEVILFFKKKAEEIIKK